MSNDPSTLDPSEPPAAAPVRPRRTLRANVAFKALSVPIEKLVRLLVLIVAAPALGEAAFGTYQFVTTVASFLIMGTELGLSVWTSRAIARDRASAGRVVSTAMALRGAGAGLYVIGIATAAIVLPGVPWQITALVGLAALANTFTDFLGAILRGLERLDEEAVLNIARACLLALFGLGALRIARTLSGLSTGIAFGTAVSALLGIALFRVRYPTAFPDRRRFDGNLARQAVRESAPLWFATLLSLLYFKVDVIILQVASGERELGSYSAAYKLFEAMTLAPSVIMAAAFSPLARAVHDPRAQRDLERRLLIVLLVLGTAAGAAMYFLSAPLVRLVFGPAFGGAVPSLRMLSVGIPLLFLGCGLRLFLVARNLERVAPWVTGALLLLNVGLNLAVVPAFGGPGAAFATVLTEAVQTLLCIWIIKSGIGSRTSQRSPS